MHFENFRRKDISVESLVDTLKLTTKATALF